MLRLLGCDSHAKSASCLDTGTAVLSKSEDMVLIVLIELVELVLDLDRIEVLGGGCLIEVSAWLDASLSSDNT